MAIVEALLPYGMTVSATEDIELTVNDIMSDSSVPKRILPVGRNPRPLEAPSGRIGVASMTVFENGTGLIRVRTVFKTRDHLGLLLHPDSDVQARLPDEAAYYVVTSSVGDKRQHVQLLFFHEDGPSPKA